VLGNPIIRTELPLWLQYSALGVLWVIWGAALGWVWWRANENAKVSCVFATPYQVYEPLLAGFPLVLGVTGLLFLWRMRPGDEMSFIHHCLYKLIACLTIGAGLMFVFGGLMTFSHLTCTIRE
jgi:hypothetical protein